MFFWPYWNVDKLMDKLKRNDYNVTIKNSWNRKIVDAFKYFVLRRNTECMTSTKSQLYKPLSVKRVIVKEKRASSRENDGKAAVTVFNSWFRWCENQKYG